MAVKEVLETYVNETDELIHLTVNSEEITTTPTHMFFVPQKGWTQAIDLRAGDILVLVNGEYVIVEKTQHEILEEPVTVYNFEVKDFHTYHVGEQGVLTHNLCVNQHNPGATVQKHHPISKKIEEALSATKKLNGITRKNTATITASTLSDHLGYDAWHREYDEKIVKWIQSHKNASEKTFAKFLNKYFKSPDMIKRFGTVVFNA